MSPVDSWCAEMQRLEAENAALREQVDAASKPLEADGVHRDLRRVASALLIIVGAIALAVAVPAVWTRSLLLDTDRYTATVAPLASDPAIQKSVSGAAVDRIFAQADVEGRIRGALPPAATFLAPSLSDQLHSRAVALSERALASEGFAQLWERANRRMHEAAVPLLLGQHGPQGIVDAAAGTISVDISEIVRRVRTALVDSGLGFAANIPDSALGGEVVLFQSRGLAMLQTYVGILDSLALAIPLVVLAAFALGIAIARNRRRAVMWVGFASLGAMVLLALAIGLARSGYLDAVDRAVLSGPAAAVFFDTMVRFLKASVRWVALVAFLCVAGAAFAGPSSVAVAMRSGLIGGLARAESALGIDVERSSDWIRLHRLPLYLAALLLFSGVLLVVENVTASLAMGAVAGAVFVVMLVELFARADRAGPPRDRALTG